jgi:3-hydroxy-3-methylglutaryl CoA synthase
MRLTAEILREAWGSGSGTRAVSFYDEDAVTLAVEAALEAGGDGLDGIEMVVTASVSSPFAERSIAAQVAAACDSSPAACHDWGGSLRSGLGVLAYATQRVQSGELNQAMAIATDTRHGEPRDPVESQLGDGAVAFVVGTEAPGAEILATGSAFGDYLDTWRLDSDPFVRTEGSRLSMTEGVAAPVGQAVRTALKRASLKPEDVDFLALNANPKAGAMAAKACDIPKDKLVNTHWKELGNIGSGAASLALCQAL